MSTHSNETEERIRKVYVKDLKVGDTLHSVFKAIRKEKITSRAGKVFLSVSLVDRTGEVDARVFDNVEAAEGAFAADDYLLLAGKVVSFHGRPQIVIDRMEKLDPGPIDAKEFTWVAPAVEEKAEKADKTEGSTAAPVERAEKLDTSHKAARARLLRFLDDPALVQALDTIVRHLEKHVDDRVAQKLGHAPAPKAPQPRREREPRQPRTEFKAGEHKAAEHKPHEKRPERDGSLPEGLAFKPLAALVGEPPTQG
jgi:3'-5' exoribonuclease